MEVDYQLRLKMTVEEFRQTIGESSAPPSGLGPELEALWLAKADRWDEAHDIAQAIDTAMGAWIHGLLHAIEGDMGNSAYWFHCAEKEPISVAEIDCEWERIVIANLS